MLGGSTSHQETRMSAAAAPTIHRPTGAARPPHLWSRHGVIWGVVRFTIHWHTAKAALKR